MIYLMSGPSGSGKSTHAREAIGDGDTPVVSSDHLNRIISDQDYSHVAWQGANFVMPAMTCALVEQGWDVIVDDVFLTQRERSYWVRLANKLNTPICCYHSTADLKTCLARQAKRERRVPEDVVRMQHAMYQTPTLAEGFAGVCPF